MSRVCFIDKEAQILRPIILLSPACASFDQFAGFEERGNYFKNLVELLPGEHLDPFEEPGLVPTLHDRKKTKDIS